MIGYPFVGRRHDEDFLVNENMYFLVFHVLGRYPLYISGTCDGVCQLSNN